MPLKYTHIMHLEYRIYFLATNIIISNKYQTIRMVCSSPSYYTSASGNNKDILGFNYNIKVSLHTYICTLT